MKTANFQDGPGSVPRRSRTFSVLVRYVCGSALEAIFSILSKSDDPMQFIHVDLNFRFEVICLLLLWLDIWNKVHVLANIIVSFNDKIDTIAHVIVVG